MQNINRRSFLKGSVLSAGTAVVSVGVGTGLSGCSGEGLVPARFDHGVASGDPLQDRFIIWTRVTPEADDSESDKVRVFWEVAKAPDFKRLTHAGSVLTEPHRDFTVKVDVANLEPGEVYYYRFHTISHRSPLGRSKTLPSAGIHSVKMLAVSCSNYPAGFFHVYAEAAKQQDVDVALHLGDYLYEYARGEYASEDAEALGREVEPPGELFTLDDYRKRYAQYRKDADLQAFHAAMPVIAVWDDHEIANDTWRLGAENHSPETEGDFLERLVAALTAYAEWMPIRPTVDTDVAALPRQFVFGDLLNLIMLDTRISGRDKPLSYADFFTSSGFDFAAFDQARNDPNRRLLGQAQQMWLSEALNTDTVWQVLGQQVLMGKMELPGAVTLQQLSLQEFSELATIAALAASNPQALTEAQRQLLEEKGALLNLPSLPYNLDAWDGYVAERDALYEAVAAAGKRLVVVAGDTHNAWANRLVHKDQTLGVELATASVSSPGLESFLGLDSQEAVQATEFGLVQLIRDLFYTNLSDRGFLAITFTRERASAEWIYVDDVKRRDYRLLDERYRREDILADE